MSERRVVVYYDYNEDDDPEPETWGFAEVWREDDGALAYNELDETFQDSFLELETTARRMFVAVQSQETLDLSVDPPVLRPRYEIRRPESAPISPLAVNGRIDLQTLTTASGTVRPGLTWDALAWEPAPPKTMG